MTPEEAIAKSPKSTITTEAGLVLGSPTPNAAKRVDGKEDVNIDKRAYLLIYRYVNRVGNAKGDPLNLMFWFKGDLSNARIRARQHCDIMHYRYINCRPFIVDLESREH